METILATFPEPYPDEALHSVLARYGQRMGYSGLEAVARDCFGRGRDVISWGLQARLNDLVSRLPPGHIWTADQLIDLHSYAPLYEPFLPLDRAEQVRAEMKGAGGSSRVLGALGLATRDTAVLRLCPLCFAEDRARYGEAYWHRKHQAAGVMACADHGVFLEQSAVPMRQEASALVPADTVALTGPPRPMSPTDGRQQHLLAIARAAKWLFGNPQPARGLQWLNDKYAELSGTNGWRARGGPIHMEEFSTSFVGFYSAELLAQLGCQIQPNRQWSWLNTFFSPLRGAHRPLYHILVMRFLGSTAEQFFSEPLPENIPPFGSGPWPCLNPAADHYGQAVVADCSIGCSRERKVVVGHFRCDCGFHYCRDGPDRNENDRWRYDRVSTYGAVWDNALRTLWADPALSASAIARKLRAYPAIVLQRASRLGLPESRKRARRLDRCNCTIRNPRVWESALRTLWYDPTVRLADIAGQMGVSQNTVAERAKRIGLTYPRPVGRGQIIRDHRARFPTPGSTSEARDAWLGLQKEHPDWGRTQLQRSARGLHAFLDRHDREWLIEHSPVSRKYHADRPSIQERWRKEDGDLAVALERAVATIRSAQGRPLRITRAALQRLVRFKNLGQVTSAKYPRAASILADALEPPDVALVRRLTWAVTCLESEGLCVTQSRILLRSGVSDIQLERYGLEHFLRELIAAEA